MMPIYIMIPPINEEIGPIMKWQHIQEEEEEEIDCGIDHGGKCEIPMTSRNH